MTMVVEQLYKLTLAYSINKSIPLRAAFCKETLFCYDSGYIPR